jgi:hypothetical protein
MSLVFTARGINNNFADSLRKIGESGNSKLLVLLGEVGVPFDIHNHTNHASSTVLLDRTLRAVEKSNLDHTIWNYSPQNTQLAGDNWNGEDLSIRSKTSNRGLLSVVRPFAVEVSPGVNFFNQEFNPKNAAKKYTLSIICRTIGTKRIFIYLPQFHFSTSEIKVMKTSGRVKSNNKKQELQWEGILCDGENQRHQIEISNILV